VKIYNEQLRDLLVPESVPHAERGAVTIREDTKGRILLTGLHQVTINSVEDLLSALNFGSTIRQTDSTAINAKSSRSHAVFSINLVQRKTKQSTTQEKRLSVPLEAMSGSEGWITVDSKLHFVDLAGSERLKNTGASGDRAKEGISINAGLASLGKVISQLSSRQAGSHVSYRDSRLTRLLQDSLGGNAITYMIACVTPAEFHLSETLNTIQYAQRARAIQSKPRIQQVSDDSDKQAMIDRLRAEVSFLREQIRNSERGDRLGAAPQERAERQNEREVELQNHLLDIQENYSALSQRHAKLISEMTKARDDESEDPHMNGESAGERLQRSNSFAAAVEQVVLEYEKTIQSLETSLSGTRSSLANTESSLLEKETKCAYVETVNQQLQARIQKLIDREASTEQYLHDLEAKLDGRTSGEEKHTAVLTDLRKEISRLRENEATNEEYISTLEERLAEADQDMELMQREIGRLEHVVERQRSLGKLDNLLYELDHLNGKPEEETIDKLSEDTPQATRRRGLSEATLKVAVETPIPESDEDEELAGEHPPVPSLPSEYTQSPAQSKFVAEKLESVNQELFDLRVEHEATVNEYDLLAAKYEEALRTLAALQDAVDESRRPSTLLSGPATFLEDARVKETRDVGQTSSSRSLSSELSSAGESQYTSERSETTMTDHDRNSSSLANEFSRNAGLSEEIEELKALHAEREQGMAALEERYAQLEEQHLDTLDLVEELKAEVQKAQLNVTGSPTASGIRRKSSQNVMTIDRAHRSLATLGNIASENFEADPDTMQNFELNLGVVMHELHQRSERVNALEAELASVKKEMETKMMIITGLTRERTSMNSPQSPMDMSMLSAMRDQLMHSESQIKMLQQNHSAREKDLVNEIESLRNSLEAHQRPSGMPGFFPETPATNESSRDFSNGILGGTGAQDSRVAELQMELTHWQERHQKAVQSMQQSERNLLDTVADLENSLASIEAAHQQKLAELETRAGTLSATVAAFEQERDMYAETTKSLKTEVDNHRVAIGNHVSRIQELEETLAAADKEIDEAIKFKMTTHQHLEAHRDQIALLEQQLLEHESAVEFHKNGLKSLHESHAQDLEDVRRETEADANARIQQLTAQHAEEIKGHQARTQDLERQLTEHKAAVEEHVAALQEQNTVIEQLQQSRDVDVASNLGANKELAEAQSRLAALEEAKSQADTSLVSAHAKIEELTKAKADLTEELADVKMKEERASRLVEELEGQLSSTFEDSRATTGRLSLMQTTREQELMEARAAAAKAKEEIVVLSSRLSQLEVRTFLHPLRKTLETNNPPESSKQPHSQ
jgi:chromosome segregation ATPase